jgi:uncharacterized membrane protein
MAIWILLVVVAQLINSIVAIVDKYIVSSPELPRPAAYAFYLSVLSALSVGVFLFSDIPIPLEGVAIPSLDNVSSPTTVVLFISLIAGAALFGALVALFSALQKADASDVFPVVGASSAVAALILSFLLLNAVLTPNFAWGFLLLVAGTLVLSLFRFGYVSMWLSIMAGLLFGAHFVCLKVLFAETHFDNAFFWSRMGIVVIALGFLIFPFLRRQLTIPSRAARRRAGMLIVGNKILAGLASLMLLKAIELGDVSIVQAMGGLQFAFLLGFAAIFGKGLPQVCGEKCTPRQLMHKTTAVLIIIAGFGVLFL